MGRKSSRTFLGLNEDQSGAIAVFSIIGFVIGIAMIFYARSERQLADASSRVPEEITLKKLISRGPSGNNNIILTNFATCDNFVYETKKGSWTCAWVPIVPGDSLPPGQGGGQATVVHAIIKSPGAKNEKDLANRCVKPKLRGMVVNKISSLGSDAKDLLEKSYPGSNFSTCLIIEEGREPSSDGYIQFILVCGILLIPMGVGGCLLAGFLKAPRSSRLRGSRSMSEVDEDLPSKTRGRDFDYGDSASHRSERSDEDEPRSRSRREEDEPRSRSRRDEEDRDEERSSHRHEDEDDRTRDRDADRRRQREEKRDTDGEDSDRRSDGIDPKTGRHRRRRRDDD